MVVRLDDSVDKVVVTNVAALRSKYGAGGLATVRRALRLMVEVDDRRGVTTAVVDLAAQRGLPGGTTPITDVTDHELTRQAVDAVCDVAQPDYLVVLGGPDVVAHVPLTNPMPAPDPDPDVPSDLPYACPGSAGLDASALIGPQRVVGRLPDVTGLGGLAAARSFAATIRAAARWAGADPDHYRHHLTLSTVRWQLSAGATAASLFGANPAVMLAPPTAPPWATTQLAPPLHFVNLHGATADLRWLGDPGFAPALASGDLVAAAAGTVVASECCNSAELFDPMLAGVEHRRDRGDPPVSTRIGHPATTRDARRRRWSRGSPSFAGAPRAPPVRAAADRPGGHQTTRRVGLATARQPTRAMAWLPPGPGRSRYI